ncbi:MAG TPA: maleylacetoacetate isomerase [Polyangiaceae bacterium]|jgi:maleylacetoacetate isomerase
MKVTLYSYWRSSSSHRVRIALGFKAVPHETVPVNLLGGEQRSESHAKRAANAYVPALEVDGEIFIESVAILELLDDLFPHALLYPKDAFGRARVRALVETVNAGTQPLQNLSVLVRHASDHDARNEWAKHFNARGLEVFERLMERNESHGIAGPFAYGDAFGAADACLIPQVASAKRFGVDVEKFPRIARAIAASADLPFVEAAAPESQPDAPRP